MDPIFDGAAPPLPLFASPAPTICSWSVWFKLISTRSGAGEQRGRTNTRVHYSCLPWRYGNRALLLWLAIKKVASLAIILLLGVDSKFSGCCRRPRCQSPPVVWLFFFFFCFFLIFLRGDSKENPASCARRRFVSSHVWWVHGRSNHTGIRNDFLISVWSHGRLMNASGLLRREPQRWAEIQRFLRETSESLLQSDAVPAAAFCSNIYFPITKYFS